MDSQPNSNYFVDVTQVDDVTYYQETLDYIRQWAYRDQDIVINPPSVDRQVRLKYRKSLDPVTSETSTIAVFLARPFLAHKTAAYAAAFNGVNLPRGQELSLLADDYLNDLIITENRNRQSIGYRRKRFGYNTRRRL
jgi:hypothetical protein